jgi:hypothetical protein
VQDESTRAPGARRAGLCGIDPHATVHAITAPGAPHVRGGSPFCVAKVNGPSIYYRFDAYVEPDQVVSTFGDARQRFEFKKCMNEHGYTLNE